MGAPQLQHRSGLMSLGFTTTVSASVQRAQSSYTMFMGGF